MNVINIDNHDNQQIVRFIEANTDADTTINVAQGAHVSYVEVVISKSHLKGSLTVNCQNNSSVTINTIDVDNLSFQRTHTYNLNGAGINCEVKGLYLVAKGENVANLLKMNHYYPNCNSSQTFKGIVDEHALFNGHIYIAKDAQQTVALQENHNILLNDGAKVETRPWLEIYADDVKCNHGATVGKNDDQALYYMRQRGIPISEARKLLLEGFLEQCVIESPQRTHIMEIINDKLQSM